MAHPADLQRGREHRDRRDGRPARAGRGRARRVPDPDRRRRLARRDRARSPTASPPSTPTSRCCTARSARASGPRTSPGSNARSTAAPATCSRWTPTSRTTRPTSRACSTAVRDERRRPRPRLALRARAAASATGGASARPSAAAGRGTRGACSASSCATSPAASSASAPRCCATIDLPSVRSRGYAFQVELTYRAIVRGLPRRRGPDRLPRPRRWARRRCRGRSRSRPRDSCRSCAAAPGTSPMGPAGLKARARRADLNEVNVSRLALVQGMDETRSTLRRWNAAPMSALLPWSLGAFGVAVALLYAVWVVAHARRPDPSGLLLPGLNSPADVGAVGHVILRNSLVLALHALACVAGFIAGSSLPLQAEHYTGRQALRPRARRQGRDRLRRRRDDVLARDAGAHPRRRRRRPCPRSSTSGS